MKQKATRSKVAHNGKQMPQEPADSSRYLYEQIYSALKEEILSGKYRKGDWFPPERVLKDRFKTTHLTVRNALAKLVLEGYIERYSGKGTIVIYARDRASAPRKLLSFPRAHVICDQLDEGNALLLGLLETQLRKIPLPVRLSCHHGDALLAQSIYQEAQESRALIILQPAGLEPAEQQGALLPNTIIVRAAQSNAACPQVIVDDAEGARRSVRHLRDLGYDRITFLSSAAVSASMRQGFMEQVAAPGIRSASAVEASCAPGLEGGAQAARDIAAQDPACRAFFCASDETAAGCINGLRDAGLTPGTDCAVVGWGNTLLARSLRITSIDPGFDRLAERVLASVMDGMSRGAFSAGVFRINPELHVR